MAMRKHQRGMTMISWVILFALIGFVGMFGFKLFPLYMEYNSINTTMNTVAKGAQPNETAAQLRSSIDGLFDVNSVNVIKGSDVDIKLDPDTKALAMTVDYDARTNFIANVDLVVHFHKVYTAGGH